MLFILKSFLGYILYLTDNSSTGHNWKQPVQFLLLDFAAN